jgi:hypothetical protein
MSFTAQSQLEEDYTLVFCTGTEQTLYHLKNCMQLGGYGKINGLVFQSGTECGRL